MKKLPQKGVLLFGVVLAVCAFVGPSMASAASWAGAGTHQLLSTNLAFTNNFGGTLIGWTCAQSTVDFSVTNAGDAAVIGSRFTNCRGVTAAVVNCTLTTTGSNFPWTATATTTTNLQIHNIHWNQLWENQPANPTACALNGLQLTYTGTLTGGSWDPSSVPANKRLTFNNADGLTGHPNNGGGSQQVLMTGTFRDLAGTLDVLM
jgi:hypothetical protein